MPARDVTRLHLLCDLHEVLLVDGAWTESIQPGEYAMIGLASDHVREVFTLFPEPREPGRSIAFRDALTAMRGFEAQIAKSASAAA